MNATKNIWKRINGKMVNNYWVIDPIYSINEKGEIRNDKTGHIYKVTNGKVQLKSSVNGNYDTEAYCTFTHLNIIFATYYNVDVFNKRIEKFHGDSCDPKNLYVAA